MRSLTFLDSRSHDNCWPRKVGSAAFMMKYFICQSSDIERGDSQPLRSPERWPAIAPCILFGVVVIIVVIIVVVVSCCLSCSLIEPC